MAATIMTDFRGHRAKRSEMSIRQRHVTFRMAPDDVKKLDQLAIDQGTNRSGVLKRVLREFLESA